MLFQWFDATAYLPDDNIGNALERLKPDYIYDWLEEVSKTHFEVIVSCLLPHPVEYARVGGFWDYITNRTTQIKEGLNCFFCLVPYDIITFEIWDYVMPYWLEAIRTEVPAEDLHELKVLLSKSFDIDMCPLPFTLEKMYCFISERFSDPSAYVQEQALQWLQILSTLDIIIPMHMLLGMFLKGVQNLHVECTGPMPEKPLKKPEGAMGHQTVFPGSPTQEKPPPLSPEKTHVVVEAYEVYERETELVLPCYIMMLDLYLKELELQEFPKYLGIYNETSKQVMQMIAVMLKEDLDGTHTCSDDQQQACNFCHNIALWHQLMSQVMCNFCPRDPAKIPTKEVPRVEEVKQVSSSNSQSRKNSTSTEEDESEEKEKSEPKFDIKAMPLHLQLYHAFLLELERTTDTDASYSLLTSMKYLILHAESLNYTVNQYPNYVKFSLVRHLIPSLWKCLIAQHSQLAFIAVPLLVHCLTLPTGADICWKIVEDAYTSEDWRVRFAAVEKVTVLCRLLDLDSISHNQVLQTALAHAFCLLIGSLEDMNSAVAQRAVQYLETIKTSSIRCLCRCLEFQFDHVISDRIMIIQRMRLLSNVLKEDKILTWDFFLSRLDTLSLEAQIDLENSDIFSADRENESFLKKLNRARFALARTDSIRSVSQSCKPPYRRAVSVPMHLVTRTAPPKQKLAQRRRKLLEYFDLERQKSCIRQHSAPHFNLGRRMTKMNFGAFSNVFPGNLKEFSDEDSNFTALLQKAMDMDGVDRDTVSQLVALLMKFMVSCDINEEDKSNMKTQNVVLRHLNILLGYNQTEKSFTVPPHKLRTSAVFNSFLSGVPFVLDRNFKLGNQILPITLLLLQHGPSPQRYASDYQPPNYTLWYLEPHTQISWLTTLLVILYKYQFYTSPVSAIIQTLIRIVINTVDAQHHRCKKSHEEGFIPPSPTILRSREPSKLNDLENIQETDTPPSSPKNLNDTVNFDGGAVHFKKGDKVSPIREQVIEEAVETSKRPLTRTTRKPRRLIEYSEPNMAPARDNVQPKNATSAVDIPKKKEEPKDSFSTSPAKIETSPVDDNTKTISVEKVMAKNLQEFSKQPEKGIGKIKSVVPGDGIKVTCPPMLSTGVSSSATDVSSTWTGVTSTTDMSHDLTSELESADDSDKNQTTSDTDSDKLNTSRTRTETTTDGKDEKKSSKGTGPKPNFRQRKNRKTGLTTVELQTIFPELNEPAPDETTTTKSRRSRKSELLAKKAVKKPSASRYGDNVMLDRCAECNAILEQYDDDVIGYCIVVLATFIHREPSLATPLLLEMLQCVSRIASSSPYAWQAESNLMVPGNSLSIARQFLRCVLHQLAPNGIFPMLFQSNFEDTYFFKTMATALVDFTELTCQAPIQFLLEGLNSRKNLPSDNIMLLLNNLSMYINCISLESSAPMWNSIILQFDIFLRKLPTVLPNPCDMTPVLKIITAILKVSGVSTARFILEPFSKLLSFAIENCNFKLQHMLDICSLGNRSYVKERDKLYLTRTVVFELVQAMKFKISLPDENFLLLVQFVVLDTGGTIANTNILGEQGMLYMTHANMLISTCAAESMRDHLNECLEFISDIHTLSKVKNNMKSGSTSLNEDTLGSQLKSGIAQYIALEITRGNNRDTNRAIIRYLPWLYHPPSTVQQGPKEFTDCIGHIRTLSWVLIGSLTHTAMTEGAAPVSCLPIPLDASSYVAEHVLVIMTGFDERSKDSVLHMSSLFHAFILCQLWSMYCESAAAQHPVTSESHQIASSTIMDFWARVTPGILQLLSTPKEFSEKVNLHFLGLMEALRECNSSVLAKLFPMWTSILFTYHSQLPGHLQVRLQSVENWEPPAPSNDMALFNSSVLLSWLKRIQFKLGQNEIQSSAATQFYTV